MLRLYKYLAMCLISLLVQSYECQLEFPIFDIHSLNIGDSCQLENGQQGVCTEIRDCLNLKRSRRRFVPIVCSYNLRGPIVCCNDRSKERISVKKCREYKNLVEVGSRVTIEGLNVLAIAGGQAALVSEFPHMAAIGFKMPDESIQWKCGGSLISENFVLTAAHCIKFGE